MQMAMGGAVSLTAAIEAGTVGGDILISQTTLDAIRGFAETGPVADVVANLGKAPIQNYPVVGLASRPAMAQPNQVTCPNAEHNGARQASSVATSLNGQPGLAESAARWRGSSTRRRPQQHPENAR